MNLMAVQRRGWAYFRKPSLLKIGPPHLKVGPPIGKRVHPIRKQAHPIGKQAHPIGKQAHPIGKQAHLLEYLFADPGDLAVWLLHMSLSIQTSLSILVLPSPLLPHYPHTIGF